MNHFMLLTPHTLVGVAVGASIPNPYIAVPLSFVLHFVGDTVPHWDFFSGTSENKEVRLKGWRPLAVMADLAVGVAVGTAFTLYALWVIGDAALAANIFMCGVASTLPDALESPHIYMGKEWRALDLVTNIQKRLQFQAPLPWGVISQVIVSSVMLLLILSSILSK